MNRWYLGIGLFLVCSGVFDVMWVRGQSAPVQSRHAITVVITSDEQTWVSVANVRPPSKFKAMTLQLRPGVYEIVGRRKGFRDETTTLVVKEGMPAAKLSVICTVNAEG